MNPIFDGSESFRSVVKMRHTIYISVNNVKTPQIIAFLKEMLIL